jgi:hypothetical protein
MLFSLELSLPPAPETLGNPCRQTGVVDCLLDAVDIVLDAVFGHR